MSLSTEITSQLQLLATGELVAAPLPTSDDCLMIATPQGDLRASLEFFDHDRYSVTMRALEVRGAAPIGDDVRAFLSARAAAIVRRLSYLEEPLAVWELDSAEKCVHLRSSPPLREAETVSYWEVTLAVGEQCGARLMRYRWAPGMIEREPVAYPITFALVGRLADSLAAALLQEEL